eukprot:g34070.t1
MRINPLRETPLSLRSRTRPSVDLKGIIRRSLAGSAKSPNPPNHLPHHPHKWWNARAKRTSDERRKTNVEPRYIRVVGVTRGDPVADPTRQDGLQKTGRTQKMMRALLEGPESRLPSPKT